LPPRRRRRKAISRRLLGLASLVILGVSLTSKLGCASYSVTSASMEPTLHCAARARCQGLKADRILANRWIFRVRGVKRRDVVILKTRAGWCGNGALLVKRVIGIPGDRVRVGAQAVYLNGRLVTAAMRTSSRIRRLGSAGLFRLQDGHYFVLGDNAAVACDSRTEGPVTRDMIVAKAVLVWSPLRRVRFL
jgi:signal peptidase I